MERDKRLVVLDGKEGKKHDGLVKGSRIVFDSASSFHYLAMKGNGVYLIEERMEQGPAGRSRDFLLRYQRLLGE